VLIVSCGDQRVGVEVDAFAERVDVLLRPMTGLLSGLGGILGSALLGDGRVPAVGITLLLAGGVLPRPYVFHPIAPGSPWGPAVTLRKLAR
jgi:chemotaxis protein histidine kinase CheA